MPLPITAPPVTPGSPAASAAPGASSSVGVVRDDSLTAILPPDLDGTPVTLEEASFQDATADPGFRDNVERAAFFVVASAEDLASGVVAIPRSATFGDSAFTDWRETYSEGVCAQAGGVATNAETTIDGRTVWITTCAGGLTVYQAFVEERSAIVSLFSLGDARYGERLIGDLRP
ncbi:MAG TPA: hypothetical protein VFY23_09085 [Candidatus Limnocylindrales bacterium]|nr:hypothetical protein [Candidatus Limnocylindrales bacterium]